MSVKSIKISFYLYLFLILSIGSFKAYAGGDPDEMSMEEEYGKEEIITEVKKILIKDIKNLSVITAQCISFPEAIAYKEHFACKGDIEKNRIARLNWSFTKLLLR